MRCLNMHEAHLMLATINNHSCGHVGGSFYRHLQPQGLKLLAIMAKDASGI